MLFVNVLAIFVYDQNMPNVTTTKAFASVLGDMEEISFGIRGYRQLFPKTGYFTTFQITRIVEMKNT